MSVKHELEAVLGGPTNCDKLRAECDKYRKLAIEGAESLHRIQRHKGWNTLGKSEDFRGCRMNYCRSVAAALASSEASTTEEE